MTHATSSGQSAGNRRGVGSTLAEEMMIDTEAAVMANFDFLSSEGVQHLALRTGRGGQGRVVGGR